MICKAMDNTCKFWKSLPLKTYRLNSFRKWSWLTSICYNCFSKFCNLERLNEVGCLLHFLLRVQMQF